MGDKNTINMHWPRSQAIQVSSTQATSLGFGENSRIQKISQIKDRN